jgi:hypothetical protein
VVLAYLISWASVIPAEGGLLPQGPMIAAFIVLAIVAGRRGVAGLWQQMTHWRVGARWYLIAPGIIIGIHLATLAMQLLLGARVASTAHLRSPAYFNLLLPLILLGGWWEEPGWMGYLLRRFQERFLRVPLLAALSGGLIRMAWHTPLLVYGKISWYDYLFYSLALQVILTWLYNRTNGSVLVPMLGHLFSNVLFATMYPLFQGSGQQQYWVILVLTSCVFAAGLILATRGRLGARGEASLKPALTS